LKISFKYKLFITFLFYGFSLVFLTQFIIFKINEMSIKTVSVDEAKGIFLQKDKLFHSYIHGINLKIESINRSEIFSEYLNNKVDSKLAKALFIDIARTSDNIMQLRYIDNDGKEVIRVDRKGYGREPFLITDNKLQNKSSRYYFKEIMKTKKGQLWYSNLDLNMEQDKIERPLRPVIRLGVSVYNGGKKDGVLIINILMDKFLQHLISIPFFELYLIDSKGNILVDSIDKHCWSKYLKNDKTIYKVFGDLSDKIINNEEYIGENFYSKEIFLDNSEKLKMVIKPNNDKIQHEIDKQVSELLWVMLGVIFFSFPFAYFFSRTPIRLNEMIDSQKREQDILLSLFDLSNAVLFKWNNDENWSVSTVSKSVEKLLGYTKEDFEGNNIFFSMCIHPDDIERVIKEVDEAIKSDLYFFEHKPYRIYTKDGKIKWILDSTVIVRDEDNKITSFVGYLIDITEIKDNELALKKLSRTDQLTKIYNRVHLDEVLSKRYNHFQTDGEITSIIIVDIDFFKLVNDEHGHLVGDSVLVEFVNVLKMFIRSSDVLGRWGGEEFLIILPDTNLDQALLLAEKLRKKVQEYKFSVVEHKTASFGVATLESGMSIERLIDIADEGLYKVKENGRNSVYAVQKEMLDKI